MSSKGLTLLELKMRAKAKEEEERAKAARKRNIIVLILDFFAKNGYVEAMERLSVESAISLSRWQAADNVDLSSIMQEFESFYEMKYGRQPRLVRPATSEDVEELEKAVKARKKSAPLPPLPAGMGSTPSALPAGYRSSYSSVDGYQGNSYDAATNMSNSSGGSIEQQSVGPGAHERKGSTSASGSATGSAPRDRKAQSASAKGTKAERVSSAAAAGAGFGSSSTDRVPRSEKKDRAGRDKSSTLDFALQGSAASASAASAATAHPATPAPPAATPSASRRPAASPARTPTPDDEFDGAGGGGSNPGAHSSYYETRILKPMPEYADAQFRELAHIISRDIFSENPNVRWSDIAELEEAKQLLKEAVVMPLRFPQFFTGLLSPWKGILLYGPPGTGKTMLARAVATECKTTFFNISASSIVSKYRGDSEKLVRVLFELARYHAPSTIFIDEIDSIMGRRDAAGEHEGSRRMKTELLVQMDGLSKSDDLVFVLAASNLPWDLDMALLRRLEKRILVPLPNEKARATIVRSHLTEGERARGLDYAELARRTDGYSGSDLTQLCKEAAMRPVRRLMKQLLSVESEDAEVDSEVKLDPVTPDDVRQAMACTRPSAASAFLQKYVEWHAEYGAGMADVGGEQNK